MSLKDSCWLSKGNNMADADSLIFENTGTIVINDMWKDIKTDDFDPRHDYSQGIYVEQILYYKTAIYVKLLEILFSSKTDKEMVSSIGCVEIYVHLANVDSLNCVSVKTMRSYDRKLIWICV